MELGRPHILLLDEPTNSLDPESIDALAKAINEFEGGMVLVSHDMRLISQVAKEIWICDNKTITPYQGDIQSFKLAMRAQMGLDDGTKAAPKALRGDASVKIQDATAAASTNKAPKKEAAKPKETQPLVVIPEPTKEETPVEDDETTVTTTLTGASSVSAAPGRYIPPHLRKKMLEAQASSS